MIKALLLACLIGPMPARAAQPEYGVKGIFPVYEIAADWLIFDKNHPAGKKILERGRRFLIVGSHGSGLFSITRASAAYGGACRAGRPAKLKTFFLSGNRSPIGSPIIAIHVPARFKLKGSKAKYLTLSNQVGEDSYHAWESPLKEGILEEIRSGKFHFSREDEQPGPSFLLPKPEDIALKIDFASPLHVRGLTNPFILIEGTQVRHSYRRCLRLVDGARWAGGCVPLPHELMAETSLLRFVAYDPGGKDRPYLLAYTASEPLWGHERWGFVVSDSGARMFLKDSMNPRCREGF